MLNQQLMQKGVDGIYDYLKTKDLEENELTETMNTF